MKIDKVTLENFMSHDEFTLELPTNGVVVVTGGNGSGKSSLLEAVSWGLYNKTLRGTIPIRKGQRATVTVTNHEINIIRSRKGAKTDVNFDFGQGLSSHETATNAQKALDSHIKAMDLWKRVCVFSSQDATRFTLATDTERKKFLAELLDLGRFDIALDKCKKDIREVTKKEQKVVSDKALLSGRILELKKMLESVSTLDPEPDCQDLEQLQQSKELEASTHSAYRVNLEALSSTKIKGISLGNKQKSLEKSLTDSTCSQCGQDIPIDIAPIKANIEKVKIELQLLRQEYAELDKVVETSLLENKSAQEKHHENKSRALLYQGWEARNAKNNQFREAQTVGLEDLVEQQKTLDKTLEELAEEKGILTICKDVLGTRGARVSILQDAVAGIEQLANMWLSELFSGVSVKFTNNNDKISIDVEGLAHEYGYKGSSGGERRRIDIAMMLALSEVFSGLSVASGSDTLWFDEVFDTLDEPGRIAVSNLLAELAKDRCIVIITHSDEFLGDLEFVKQIKLVGNG